MKKRIIYASSDIALKMKHLKQKRIDILSFYPNDKGDCVCVKMISEWKDKLMLLPEAQRNSEIAKIKQLRCPRDKTGMQRYAITCRNCGEVQGYCWATDPSLTDFCDFHYVQWTDGEQWFGCFTPNISPITQQLTLECTCGQDTRDFRANQTLSGKVVERLEKESRKGREFNKADSKFAIAQV